MALLAAAFQIAFTSACLAQVDTAWIRRYNGPGNAWDWPRVVQADGHGGVFVTGSSRGTSTAIDVATLRYDSSGGLEWEHRYDDSNHGDNNPSDMVIDSQNRALYVVGTTLSGTTSSSGIVLKYSLEGNTDWERSYTVPDGSAATFDDAILNRWGFVTAAGFYTDSLSQSSFLIVNYSPDGDTVWARRYQDSLGPTNDALGITATSEGEAIIVGTRSNAGTGKDIMVLKYDTLGSLLWVRVYNGNADGDDVPRAVRADLSGNIYVTGSSWAGAENFDYLTLKFDSGGNLLWERLYNGSGNGADYARALAITPTGHVCITGESWSGNSLSGVDFATLAYDSAGSLLWANRENGSYDSRGGGQAITVDGDGRVYVTGLTGHESTMTLKYSANGDFLWGAWLNRWPDLINDGASTISVDGSENCFVACAAYGQQNGVWTRDYVVVKYSECICRCHADPSNCDRVQDITDVIQVISVAFHGESEVLDTSPNCPNRRTDVNCSNSTDIVDVVKMVNVALRGANTATEFCNPCPQREEPD